jgi:HD-like signal output (HDOD) protein
VTDSDLARLRRLMPLRHLSDADFAAIAPLANVEQRKPGQTVFDARADDTWLFFVLDGEVRILDAGGDAFTLRGGSIESLHALTPHPKTRVKAVAATEVRYYRLPGELLQLGQKQTAKAGIEVDEIPDGADEADKRMMFEIYHALMSGQLVLPTLPDVALRIRTAAEDERKGADEIARIIQVDPALSAYCISVANNAGFAALSRVTEIREAVIRMGIPATRDFITAYTVRGLFSARQPQCMQLMQKAWRHSSEIAATVYVLAGKLGRLNAERALLAGLLHDIGVMVLVNEAQKHDELVRAPAMLHAVLRELGPQVTSMVLRAWKLPEEFVQIAFEAEQWDRPSPGPIDIGDLITVAHWYQGPGDIPWSLPLPAGNPPLLAKLPQDGEKRLAILDEAAAELARARQLLG